MQTAQNLLLQVGIEIDQNIPASQQIYMGNRCVLPEITSPKNHQATNLAIHPWQTLPMEIPFAPFRTHALDCFDRIFAAACGV